MSRIRTSCLRAVVVVGLLGSGLVAVVPPSAVAATITVTTTADAVSGGDGQTSLREAFTTAGANGVDDTIVLGDGLTYPLSDCAAGALSHPDGHELVVQGNGSVIEQGCDATGIIDSANRAGRLELRDLVIDGGPNTTASALEGAAVRSDSELMLTGVEIRYVVSPGGSVVWSSFGHGTTPYRMDLYGVNLHHNTGAGISCRNCSLHLRETTIADTTGSGISLAGGYPVMVENSIITRNTRAGISNTGHGLGTDRMTLESTHVQGNGRVGIRCGNCGALSMLYSHVSDNGLTAADALGGISYSVSQRKNTPAYRISAMYSSVNGNVTKTAGGGINVTPVVVEDDSVPGGVSLDKTDVDRNRSAGDGGGVALKVGGLHMYMGSVKNNTAGRSGGGIAILTRGPSEVGMTSTEVQNNTAPGDGGGVFIAHTARFFAGAPNTAYDMLSGNRAGGNGGGLSAANASEVRLVDMAVTGNTARGDGGGIFVKHTPDFNTLGTLISHNTAAGHGGGIAAAATRLKLDNTTIATNTATRSGGGARISAGSTELVNSTFSGNTALAGGGLYFTAATTASLTHVTMADNRASIGAHIAAAPTAKVTTNRSALVLPLVGTSCAGVVGAFSGVSGGFNVFRDTTCGQARSDLVTAADPQLAPFGQFIIRIPAATSPLAGRVPVANCTTPEDQGHRPRPLGPNCDAGSVEIVESTSSPNPTPPPHH